MVRHFKSDAAQARWTYLSSLFVSLVRWLAEPPTLPQPQKLPATTSRMGGLRPAAQSTWGGL
ncbi:hypothetical protein [Ramlibacter sp. AN1133]|uniref:hypothetical protein n=1 Tax=Ramlibacter sp. AN1133 TaxID=3133429 RepID=UPI0030BCD7BF